MSNTIAIDLDEVLSPFVPELMTWYNQLYQNNIQYEQFITYDFSQVWGGTQEEASAICDDFHLSRKIEDISPIPHSAQALSLLKEKFRLVLVTSRPLQHSDYTHSWINHHLPNTFSDIILCNHWTTVGEAIKKSDACKKINATYFIDDLPFYIEEVANCNIKSLLFGNYPWNKTSIPHDFIQRVPSWNDITELLMQD
jgi:5'(3')-deoxyribonucleotidase